MEVLWNLSADWHDQNDLGEPSEVFLWSNQVVQKSYAGFVRIVTVREIDLQENLRHCGYLRLRPAAYGAAKI